MFLETFLLDGKHSRLSEARPGHPLGDSALKTQIRLRVNCAKPIDTRPTAADRGKPGGCYGHPEASSDAQR
jgi:hypothetical protein